MSFFRAGRHPFALVVLGALCACRRRNPAELAVDWKTSVAERAALLVLDEEGALNLVCLPGQVRPRRLFAGVALRRILDVGWMGGPIVAGWAASSRDPNESSGDLVLLAPNAEPRRLATNVRMARLSRDGTALAYEVTRSATEGAAEPPTSYVDDLATGSVVALPAFADPLWEYDGMHLRGTYLRAENGNGKNPVGAPWTSLRARWDRASGTTTILGRGSAQIPAPVGTAVAWSGGPRETAGGGDCGVLFGPIGMRHTTVGSFCTGIADDRGVRVSPDGRWLAFPHPGREPGEVEDGQVFLDVVGLAGGRSPALTSLNALVGPVRLATTSGSAWLDWSPSQRFLAVQDAAEDVRVYDFRAPGTVLLGKGQRPTWSQGGAYLAILAASPDAPVLSTEPRNNSLAVAFVLPGVARTTWIDLGTARDLHWLAAHACEE